MAMDEPKIDAKTYGVKHDGKVIGWIPNTGDGKTDAAAAMKVLKDAGLYVPTTPFQAMFRQALSFCTTASYLYKKDLSGQPVNHYSAVPFVVNAALAIELYLKTLSAVHGKPLRGHELLKLFDNLPAVAIAEIEALCPAAAVGHKVKKGRSYRDCLHAMNDAFVDWRYLYEKQSTDEIVLNEVIFLLDAAHHACSAYDKPSGSPNAT
ncbi:MULTISPECIES: HEPN domain-containing protein [unclassified Janthinobacterium]|uniref:HEPN domain-containing protein n=1 Tax=unclassified Janthinobacterium TaxID=2610881 RepID=UPI000377B144|nr:MULTISPECIES: HEPN domain-containing protein [unclassified Janthinobacterium]MEC5159876.1 HEPN domain-containing protein [Janthinobacterium sp. CG_S6]